MSKIVRGIGKVFRKVVKVVKRVAPLVLAAAAVYFTAGAAMGLAGTAGAGWGAAAGTISSTLGATGTLGSVLTGAVTQAGYGAALGGMISKAQGGSFSEGAQSGAAVGAVTGGVGGYMQAGNAAQSAQLGQGTPVADGTGGVYQNMSPAADVGNASMMSPADVATQTANTPTAGGLLTKTAPPVNGNALSSLGKWAGENQTLVGTAVSGIGQGLLTKASADGEADAVREKYKQVRANYDGVDPGAGYRSASRPSEGAVTPTERFGPANYGSFEFQFNPKSGRIERVPIQQQAG